MLKFIKYSLAFVIGLLSLTACGDDEPGETGDVPGSVKACTAKMCGTWYCTMQEWTEDGETWSTTYEPTSDYSMRFDPDMTGYMNATGGSLFELERTNTFRWYVSKSDGSYILHTDVYDGADYKILSLTDDFLEMRWTDDDYSIRCQFVRQ